MKVGTIKCNTNQKESVRNRKISQFTAEQIAMAKVYAAHTPSDDLDPRIEALVNDLIGQVADKWTMLILEVLAEKGELRFTRLSELVEGVSQKMLTQTLRHMERDGLLTRTVHPVGPPPPGVETPLFRGEFAEEMEGQKGMDVEVLAKKAIAGIEAGKLEIRPGLSNVLKIMSRIAPNSCSTKWRRWRSPRK